ncbi:MAG: TIGR03960 family B12-binding radical SAM protein, partial [Lachnospiraceae bacterium]|nr:TIGR03960 family B12-binding radical SAM protein [Lachnospiraceae bacterium]
NEEDPIVIGGGPCAYNPEPLAPFFDIFYIGEGETVYFELIDKYKENKKNGGSRKDFLEMAAEIEGLYIPSFYDVTYKEDGTLQSFTPNNIHAKDKIVKQLVMDMSHTFYPDKPLVPFIKATQDRVVLEIQRGCIRGCRFCQAGSVYKPVRERSLDFLKDKAYKMLKSTGHEEISLSSLSSSDYSNLEGLVNFLIEEFKGKGVNISLPSLRIDAFSLDVMSKVQDIKKSSLTFAPEAGSQRLRNVINKGLTEEVILKGAKLAFDGGWNRVKLYFMLGLPTETVKDMEGIAELSEKIAELYYEIPKDQRVGKVQVVASTSFFVPKPFTPFQWASMNTKEQFLDKAKIVNTKMKEMLNRKSLKYNWHEADVSVLEGLLARGDRRVADTILYAYKSGCIYDAWGETFDNAKWEEAIRATNIDMDFYITRERDIDELLPWDFIDVGVTKQFLINEWKRAKEETVTPNCRVKCAGCGAMRFGGGVCYENKN